jgi:alcohol dehydrogenase YqhD (iron-dependent ADH family)
MQNFEFFSPTRIIFGKNTELQVGKEIRKYSGKILLHYGGGSIKSSGLYTRVVDALKAEGVDFIELPGVKPNPRLSLIREGIRLCRENGIDFVLAVGGGSVIDSAKAIGIGVPYQGDVWDFYLGKAEPERSNATGVIVTIAAAGSETSRSSVITNEDGWYKRGYKADMLRPKFAILNPELTYSLPPYQTASGIVDIMAHVMERYFTSESQVDATDRLCEAALKTMICNGPLVMKEPENYHARAEIMWVGAIAHNDFFGVGRSGDWASHQIEHELSGAYDVAHGAGLAVIFPAWMKYVYRKDIAMFAQYAVRVWDVDYCFDDPERTALEGIRRTEEFFKSLGMPLTLTGLGIGPEKLEDMADKCRMKKDGSIGDLMKLTRDDVFNILKMAL